MNDKSKPFIAGAIGGSVAAIVTCPLEVVKTKLQTASSRQSLRIANGSSRLSIQSVFSLILRSEGLPGFWRGITPSLMGVIPARATFFGSYALLKDIVLKNDVVLCNATVNNFVCASTSGCIAATITCPVWVLKTRMQLLPVTNVTRYSNNVMPSFNFGARSAATMTRKRPRFGLREIAYDMYRKEGVLAFFKGLSASYWGVAEGAIQLAMFEEMKLIWPDPTNAQLFSMGAISKLCASTITYPHEVVRTRLRDQRTPIGSSKARYKGMIQALKLIYKTEGRAGLYGGLVPHLLRVVPNSAIMYFIVDSIVNSRNESSY